MQPMLTAIGVTSLMFAGYAAPASASVVLTRSDRTTLVNVTGAAVPERSAESTSAGPFQSALANTNGTSNAIGSQTTVLTATGGGISFTGSGLTQSNVNGGTAAAPVTCRGDTDAQVRFDVTGQPATVAFSVNLFANGPVTGTFGDISNAAFARLQSNTTGQFYANRTTVPNRVETVSYNGLLPVGSYTLEIGADSIGQSRGTATTNLSGLSQFSELTFTATPEPSTLAFLGMTAFAGLRRRR